METDRTSEGGAAQRSGPGIAKVTNTPKGQSILKQFLQKWEHPPNINKPQPTESSIVDIFEIQPGRKVSSAFRAYQQVLDDRHDDPIRGFGLYHNADKGNTVRRFHGTGLKCTLGMNGNVSCCDDATCATCNIIKFGFDMDFSSDGRYGKGLYATAASSKAHDYAGGNAALEAATGKKAGGFGGYKSQSQPQLFPVMCVMTVLVAAGKGHKEQSGQWQVVSKLPDNHDSVLGEPGMGLNYDEIVVYRNDAMLPRYLVYYQL